MRHLITYNIIRNFVYNTETENFIYILLIFVYNRVKV